MANDIGDRV